MTESFAMKRELLCLALPVALAGTASAQQPAPRSYPNRPVRIIVPFAPGGGTDIISRVVAQKLNEAWGQTVIVDNRAGANGIIGTEMVAKAKPDGYTLGVIIANHAINPSLYRKLPYDSLRDFSPVTLMAQYPYILTVHPSVPAKSVRELIALARARPGQLSYASSGNGSGPHLGMELFKRLAKIDIVHVPYKGASPANTDLLAGQVQVMFDNFLAAMPFITSHRLRVLAVTTVARSKVMPELPTIAESGLLGFDVKSYYAMVGPAGIPAAIVNKVQSDVSAALLVPAVHERLAREGAEPVGSTPEQLDKLLQSEIRKWSEVVREANVKPESF
jgi:tripartite-type tricarboxylate transporter receptor subunit TctC